MARLPRVVVPDHPHHITQRGVRSLAVFHDDADRKDYLDLIRASCDRHGVDILVWCLMTNHVHFIAVPHHESSLAKAFGEAHKAYTRSHNFREGVRGYLFQGRFGSYVMDEPHLLAAARYVLLNPVRAGMARRPVDWPWSSARFHLGRCKRDELIRDGSLLGLVSNWREFLGNDLNDTEASLLETRLSSGRPLGSESFLERLEKLTGRVLIPRKGGWPKGKRRKADN